MLLWQDILYWLLHHMDIHYFGTNRNFQHVKNFEDKVQDYTAFKTLSKKYLLRMTNGLISSIPSIVVLHHQR